MRDSAKRRSKGSKKKSMMKKIIKLIQDERKQTTEEDMPSVTPLTKINIKSKPMQEKAKEAKEAKESNFMVMPQTLYTPFSPEQDPRNSIYRSRDRVL